MAKWKDKILNSFFRHRWALIVCLVAAIIYGIPGTIAKIAIDGSYKGMPYLVNDSEGEYLGRTQEIFDGHYSVSSPVFYEYKNAVSLIPPTGEFIFYALPKYLFGFSTNSIITLSRFIYPALIFLFIYLLIFSISIKQGKSRTVAAIAGGSLVVFGSGIVDYRGFINYLLHQSSEPALLPFSRLVNPVSGMLLLSVLLLILWKMTEKERSSKYPVIGSLILAIMSGYIFSFALGLTIASFIALYFFISKKWTQALKVITIPAAALILNSAYLLQALMTVSASSETSNPLKSGMFYTHVPTTNLVAILTTLIFISFFIFAVRNRPIGSKVIDLPRYWWFLIAIILACLSVYLEQLITGITVWPQHFAQYTVPLLMLVLVVLVHNEFAEKAKWLWVIVMSGILFASVTLGIRSIVTVGGTLPQYLEEQSFAPVFEWLNKNAAKDCVVYVASDYGNEINRFVAAMTPCNVYHSFHVYNAVTAERIMHNFLVNMRLRGIKQNEVANHFKENWYWTQAYFFRDWGDMFCCSDPWLAKFKNREEIQNYFDTVLKEVQSNYLQYAKTDLAEELRKYRLDYFIVDNSKQPQVNPSNFPFLVPVFKSGKFAVYSMK